MSMVLGLRGLPAPEVALVKSIVRLSSMLTCGWTVTQEGPCDVQLTDGAAYDGTLADGRAQICILREGIPEPEPVLRRPIRAEALVALLNAESARHNAPVPSAASASVCAAEPSLVPGNAGTPGGAARLRRWPSWDLLKEDRAYLRMATMLSSASLTADRLSELSGAKQDACLAFMRHMDAHQLLVWAPVPNPEPGVTASVVSDAPTPAPRRPNAPAGLLHSLRRRLGLAGAA